VAPFAGFQPLERDPLPNGEETGPVTVLMEDEGTGHPLAPD